MARSDQTQRLAGFDPKAALEGVQPLGMLLELATHTLKVEPEIGQGGGLLLQLTLEACLIQILLKLK